MTQSKLNIIIIFGLVSTLWGLPALADRQSLPIQGYVIDQETGEPLTGLHTVIFSLYDSCNATDPLVRDEQQLGFSNGVYNTKIQIPLEAILNVDALCIGVQVEHDEDMQPRIEYSSTPYAKLAERADVADIATMAKTALS